MILLTGGTGRLGSEIRKIMDVWAPTREELDIKLIYPKPEFAKLDLIIHAAAYTNVDGAETERQLCYETNVIGTRNLARLGVPMLYISTDSVFDGRRGGYNESDIPYPRNFYSLSKYLGELEVKDGVIFRCSTKPRPWSRDSACTDRFFSAEYMDETAQKIKRAVEIFNRLPRIIHVGSPRRSHYDMARETRPDVEPVEGLFGGHAGVALRGRDTSLDTSLWEAVNAAAEASV